MAAVRRFLALIPVSGWVQKTPLSELDGIYPPGFFFFIDLVSRLITNTCQVSPNLSYSQEAGSWPRTTRVTPVIANRHWGTGGLTKSGSRAVTHQYLSAQGPQNRNQEGAFGGISHLLFLNILYPHHRQKVWAKQRCWLPPPSRWFSLRQSCCNKSHTCGHSSRHPLFPPHEKQPEFQE